VALEADLAVALAPTLAVMATAWAGRRRSNTTHAQLAQIQLTVNSRLDAALEKIGHLEAELLESQPGSVGEPPAPTSTAPDLPSPGR
jgi:hypothetical protein